MKTKDKKYRALAVFSIVMMIVGFTGSIITSKIEANDEATAQLETLETAETETEIVTEETAPVFEPIQIETEAEPKIDKSNDKTIENMPNCDFGGAYSDNELLYLAKIIENEAGSNWCTDEHQRAVASVVINRVSDPRFPDTIYGVISQGWNGECALQYNVGSVERFNSLEPSERALANAKYVLEHGSTVDGAIWQAEFVQGEIVAVFAYPYSTTYICR